MEVSWFFLVCLALVDPGELAPACLRCRLVVQPTLGRSSSVLLGVIPLGFSSVVRVPKNLEDSHPGELHVRCQ